MRVILVYLTSVVFAVLTRWIRSRIEMFANSSRTQCGEPTQFLLFSWGILRSNAIVFANGRHAGGAASRTACTAASSRSRSLCGT